jgi:tetratricopeptide (TPR) repeat protein
MKTPRRHLLTVALGLVLAGCNREPSVQDTFQKGLAHYKNAQYAQAARCFEHTVAAVPGHAPAWNFLGVCQLETGQTDAGIRSLEQALRLDPNYSAAHYNLGLAQLEHGQPEAAIAHLRQAQQSPTAPADTWQHLALAYQRAGATKQAEQLIAKHSPPRPAPPAAPPTKPAPVKPTTNFTTTPPPPASVTPAPATSAPAATAPATPAAPEKKEVVVYTTPPPPPPPVKKTRTPVATQPPKAGNRISATLAFNDGVRLHQRRDLIGAIAAYTKAVAADPSFAAAHYNLAIACRDAGQTEQALDHYEYALLAKPDYTDARYNYALLLQQLGYTDDAVRQFEEILKANPKDAGVHLSLATIYVRDRATTRQARDHYEAYLKLQPNSPLARDIRTWLDKNAER